MRWRDPRRRPLRLIVVLVLLTALTGCLSLRSFAAFRCPCYPQIVPLEPVKVPAE
jgi:hypothetical protein